MKSWLEKVKFSNALREYLRLSSFVYLLTGYSRSICVRHVTVIRLWQNPWLNDSCNLVMHKNNNHLPSTTELILLGHRHVFKRIQVSSKHGMDHKLHKYTDEGERDRGIARNGENSSHLPSLGSMSLLDLFLEYSVTQYFTWPTSIGDTIAWTQSFWIWNVYRKCIGQSLWVEVGESDSFSQRTIRKMAAALSLPD